MSREVTLPDTSLEAYRALTPEKLSRDYANIKYALECKREATYEEIADYLDWVDKNKVSRRLKEMEAAQIVYKPGYKKLTSRNRQAYLYRLVPTKPIQKTLFQEL